MNPIYLDEDTGEQIDTQFHCKEDNFVNEWLKLLISEVVLRYVYYIFWQSYWFLKHKIYYDDYEQEFELSDEINWFLQIEVIIWQCQLIYPVISFMAVVFMLIHSKYLIYRLKNQKKQPESSSNDMKTGNVMNMYLTYTFCLVFINYSVFLGVPLPRDFFFYFR